MGVVIEEGVRCSVSGRAVSPAVIRVVPTQIEQPVYVTPRSFHNFHKQVFQSDDTNLDERPSVRATREILCLRSALLPAWSKQVRVDEYLREGLA